MVAHWFAYLVGAEVTLDLADDAPPFLGVTIPVLPLPAAVNMYVPQREASSMLVHRMFGSLRFWPSGYPMALLGEPQSRLVRRTTVWPFIQYGTGCTAQPPEHVLLTQYMSTICMCHHDIPSLQYVTWCKSFQSMLPYW